MRIQLPLGQVPDGTTVTKAKGDKRYTVVRSNLPGQYYLGPGVTALHSVDYTGLAHHQVLTDATEVCIEFKTQTEMRAWLDARLAEEEERTAQ